MRVSISNVVVFSNLINIELIFYFKITLILQKGVRKFVREMSEDCQ